MGDIVTVTLPAGTDAYVNDLTWHDRGRLVAIATEAAVYVGYITAIIFHSSGRVQINLERNGVKAEPSLPPDHRIQVSNEWREKP